MKKLFWLGLLLVAAVEFSLVYFIMPMPGSQRMRSLDLAYKLYGLRWVLRGGAVGVLLLGAATMWRATGMSRTASRIAALIVAAIVYQLNFRMSADHMFRQPEILIVNPPNRNVVEGDRLVVGVAMNGEARAYPLQYIGYHHQVRDTIAGQPILVSYCTVCRTGRVFRPTVNGKVETFRLVGMDRFNAMFEDRTTGSWWRQANGEAVTGPLKGTKMPELPSVQVTLKQWLALYPDSWVMQADPTFRDEYAKDYAYERGTKQGGLTGTDTIPWQEKSWVVGIEQNGAATAYDWRALRRLRVINDTVGGVPIVLALGPDGTSFFAFRRPSDAVQMTARSDSLVGDGTAYALNGRGTAGTLTAINASQEFWHSWQTFHPATARYER
jgi:hypothetical protein